MTDYPERIEKREAMEQGNGFRVRIGTKSLKETNIEKGDTVKVISYPEKIEIVKESKAEA